MATELTAIAQIKADSQTQEPQMVVRIDGVETLYGAGSISKYVRIGDPELRIGNDWVIGGLNAYPEQLDVVDLSGSSNTISQQLLQDKGGTSSVSSVQISLIDKDEEMTRLITPNVIVEDILGRKAEVFFGYQGTAFPQDFVRIFTGMIDEVQGGATIILNVAHPEQKKRVEIFQNIKTDLTTDFKYRSAKIQGITYQTRRDVVGTVTVTYTSGGIAGSELILVSGNNLTVQIQSGVTRAKHIRNAIEKSVDALSLVAIRVEQNQSELVQTTQSTTSLDSDVIANVVSTIGMMLPVPSAGFRTYVQIGDEVIEYTSLTDTTIEGCTRAALENLDERAEGSHHTAGTSISTFYRIEGDAIEIALRVLMSGPNQYYAENIPVKSIVNVEEIGDIANAVWFEAMNIQDAWGLSIGELVTIQDDPNPANNVTLAPIQDIVATPYGSYIVLAGVDLVSSLSTTAKAFFASKWNVLPEGAGLGLGGDEVDVPEFEKIREVFASSILPYDFYMKDSVTAKDFLDTEVLFPTGCYTLPRRGKISVGKTSPPLTNSIVKVLDDSNTTKPQNNKVKRSLTKYFYNNVVFKYNEAVVDSKFLSGDIDVNQDSKNRIKVGNKSLVIPARGLRPSAEVTEVLSILKKRFNDMYKFAAESITMSAFYGKVFDTDVGDTVIYGRGLKIPDTKSGNRNFTPRLFTVANKSLSIKNSDVKLELVDTGYSLNDGRYGVISPSTLCVNAGSNTSQIKIKNSYGLEAFKLERLKWQALIGEKIIVHDEEYDVIAETVLQGFSPSDNYLMLVNPPLPWVPQDDYIIDIAPYPDSENPEEYAITKRIHVFTNPTVEIVSGASDTQLDVGIADIDKFKVGATLLIRDTEWDVVSPEVKVTDITGNTITVGSSLGFTPLAGYEIDLIGFKDGGAPYRYL